MAFLHGKKSMHSKNTTSITQLHILFIGIVATLFLLAGVIILAYAFTQTNNLIATIASPTSVTNITIPDLKITPPPSLPEIAATLRPDYPELADLLENPELGSVYKDFYLAYQNGGKEAAIALARQRNILNDKDEIILTLTLDTDNSAPLIAELEAEEVIVYGHYQNLVNIAIPIQLIEERLNQESPELILERISQFEHVIRLGFPNRATVQQRKTLGQGVDLTLASSWHAQGISGAGVKVGILDLGFAGYEELLGKELPESVTVGVFGDTYHFSLELHGTACAEIIHEMAPEADLYLAYYDGTDAAMGQAVDWLIEQEVHIINNSTNSIGTTPLDGTGFSVDLVNKAHHSGVLWINSAGNYAERHYRGEFKDLNSDNLHDFNDTTKQVLPFIGSPEYETRIVLTWNDWDAVDQDYDLLLYTEDGTLLAKSEEPQTGQAGQEPIEGFLYTFEEEATYLLSIENYGGAARGDVIFDLFIEPSIMHPDFIVPAHSLGSPADAERALAVGATYWFDDRLEPYSSRGPTTDGRFKPDMTAPTDVDTASYNPEAFVGTSAATPHVTGAAALVWQANPQFQNEDVKQFLQDRAIDLGDAGIDNDFGAGRLNLGGSPIDPMVTEVEPLKPLAELRATSTPHPPEITEASFGNYQPPTPTPNQSDPVLGAIMLIGFCLVCMSALLFMALVVAVFMVFM